MPAAVDFIPKWPKEVDGWLGVDKDVFILRKIVVPPQHRGKGLAKTAMSSLIKWADKRCTKLALTPSPTWGADEKKLRAFYSGFGFVGNRSKKIKETMIRNPRCSR